MQFQPFNSIHSVITKSDFEWQPLEIENTDPAVCGDKTTVLGSMRNQIHESDISEAKQMKCLIK